jgi:LysW-gamma-L-lysine carboxypeptidase
MDRDAAIRLLEGLVAVPSVSGHEAAAARWLAEQMRAAGYDRAFVDAAGNAVGEMGAADARRTIVLLGHIDTVPGDIPVRLEMAAGRHQLYGRGSVDAKGPLAAFVAAVARLGPGWARERDLRLVVAGAVEEETATSRGARFIADRFNGVHDTVPAACLIGEPSRWHRVTLGYKGRLLLDVVASQPMAHTAGPDRSVAMVAVDLWNWIAAHAARVNAGRPRVFDQLTPTLRRFATSTTADMVEVAEARIAWRLPPGIDAPALADALVAWTAEHLGASPVPAPALTPGPTAAAVTLAGARTRLDLAFRGWEPPWRGGRQSDLVRSFLAAIRTLDPAVEPGFVLKTGTSDMNVVAPLWRCPIVAYGPGDSAFDHTPDEHVELDEYWKAIQVLERMLQAYTES